MSDGTPTQKQLFVFEHDAGRLELLIRIVYWILIGIVNGFMGSSRSSACSSSGSTS